VKTLNVFLSVYRRHQTGYLYKTSVPYLVSNSV